MRKSNFAALGALAAAVACNTPSVVTEPPPLQPPQPPPQDPASQPTFGSTVTAGVAPPPISGGTMLVTRDGNTVALADPDRDLVYVVDVAARRLVRTVALQAGDEPGRLAEDGAGLVHVALRGAGALATIDPGSGVVLERRAVCPAPRGVAWDATTDAVYVACATGELVTLPCAAGTSVRTVTVERDLRDVLVRNGAISVSTFRSSEVLELASDGSVARRVSVANDQSRMQAGNMLPQVAWRSFVDAVGDTVVVHQLHSADPIPTTTPGAYGCSGTPTAVLTDLTVLHRDGSLAFDEVLANAVLPVDIAFSPDGKRALVAAAGNAFTENLQTVHYVALGTSGVQLTMPVARLPGPAIAVAFDRAGDALVQTREPAVLWIVYPGTSERTPIPLSTISRANTGHEVFHAQAGGFLACASCHPEGGEDGHVWTLDDQPRRTPSLRGTVAGTAPYHWPGDEVNFPTLANEVYSNRMSGPTLGAATMAALQTWVESIPAPPSPSWVDVAAAQRGKALFEGDTAGCSSCHRGPKLTNNATIDVGTGGAFQVPPLVGVGWRTPLLHDGCASTLEQRFTTCATPAHGSTSSLPAGDVSDLVAYLQSL